VGEKAGHESRLIEEEEEDGEEERGEQRLPRHDPDTVPVGSVTQAPVRALRLP